MSNCRVSRPRPAPSAWRVASSRSRATRPDQHEVGDVHRPDRENEQHAAPEQEQRPPYAGDHVLLERGDDGVKPGVDRGSPSCWGSARGFVR